jgi:hypothetical protein
MKRLHVEITFVEPILGTGNSNSEIHSEFIASKAPDAKSREEEVAAIGAEAVEEKTTTVFSRDTDGTPIIWNYQVKGFFKEACGMLQRQKGEKCAKESCKLKAYKKIIDGCIEPTGDTNYGRKIKLILPDGFEMGKPFQRPLRGQTAQGERIALASSEILPEGTKAQFYIEVPDAYLAAVEEWMRYGIKHGLGQWRNAGYGRFRFEVLESVEV